jgi:hypothetical protein
MTKPLAILCLLIATSAFSQSREIYENPNFASLARDHKKLAILPFKTVIVLTPRQMDRMTPEQFKQLQIDEGLAVQNAMQSYFLERKEQHDLTVDIQDLATTNALLAKGGVEIEKIHQYTPAELCEYLGVDGLISGMLTTNKPMSEGAAIALGALVGFYGSTNSGQCTININDGATGELLWKYQKTLSRGLGSDTNTIINALMRKASKQFPYIVK